MQARLYSSLITIAFAMILGLSCSHDDEEPARQVDKLLSRQIIHWYEINHDNGDTQFLHYDSTYFIYNSFKRPEKINNMTFSYNTEGKLIMTQNGDEVVYYKYENELLTSVTTNGGYYDGDKFIDTTRFYYNNQKLKYLTSSHEKARQDISFYDNNRLKSKFISRNFNNKVVCDSLLYTWTNGNLTKLVTCSGYPNNVYKYSREYSYDNHPCFTSAIHYPTEYLFVREITQFYNNYPLFYYDSYPWRFGCTNNPVLFMEMNNYQMVEEPYLINYDSDGYPIKIVGKNFIMQLIYQ